MWLGWLEKLSPNAINVIPMVLLEPRKTSIKEDRGAEESEKYDSTGTSHLTGIKTRQFTGIAQLLFTTHGPQFPIIDSTSSKENRSIIGGSSSSENITDIDVPIHIDNMDSQP